MKTRWLATLLLTASTVSAAWADEVPIDALYQSYLKSGRSADEMPEFGQRLDVTGVVLGQFDAPFGGTTFFSVGARGESGDELARATFRSSTSPEKLKALRNSAPFNANCKVGFTINADFVALQDCTLSE